MDRNFFPPWELIVHEGVNSMMTQNAIQITRKTIAGIFPSKTQEHIIFVLVSDGGRGGSFVCQKSHSEMVRLRRSKRNRRKKA